MRIMTPMLLIALAGLQYKLWLGDGSIVEWRQVEKKYAAQKQINKQLAERNRLVAADVQELQSGDQALEEQARSELGMIKEGELYYHFAE